jgi:PAS domain S-box-containing protein
MTKTVEEILTPESAEVARKVFAEELALGRQEQRDLTRSRTMEVELRCKDGSTVWTEVTMSLLYDPDNQPVGVLGITRDISERKRGEKEKAELEEKLRQSQKMEAIGALAGGIAHDFNNVLGIIVGNTELAMNDVPGWNPAYHNLQEVMKACMRARDVVRQILSFSRQAEQRAIPVRIGPIIDEALKFLRSSVPTTIEIRPDVSCSKDTIRADATQINQVLINLCTNAAHSMRDKGGILQVSLRNTELDQATVNRYPELSAGEYLTLSVSDTGHGMEPGIMQRIFEPYYTTKDVGEGTGMGLAVVHGIVKGHDGAIRVHSEPGKGTTFDLLFPLVEIEAVPESVPSRPLPMGNERVLFVDDEKALADLGERMLQQLGYEVTVRTSSIEALETFRAEPDRFDLLVTDMTMPKMTGEELSKEVLRVRPGFPIILCTGFSEKITEEEAVEIGIQALMIKPLAMRELAEILRQVLEPV